MPEGVSARAHELFRTEPGQILIKGHQHQLFNAEQLQQRELLLRQSRRSRASPCSTSRGWGQKLTTVDTTMGLLAHRIDYAAVAGMEAVKAAKGQRRGLAGLLW